MQALAAWALSLGLWASVAGAAFGHATLVRTAPADQAVLAEGIGDISLVFSEPVSPIRVEVVDGRGARATVADVMAHDETVHVTLAHPLPPGGYLVFWRVVSADSHPIGGAFAFSIGRHEAEPPRPPHEVREDSWQAARIIVRALRNWMLMMAAGGALFLGLVLRDQPVPAPVRRILLGCGIIAVALAGLELGFQGGLMQAGSPATLLDVSTWRLGTTTTLARSVGGMVAGLLLAAAGLLLLRDAPRRLALSAGGALAAASLAFTGHAASGSAVAATVLALHAITAAFWLGAFVPLLALAREGGAACAPLLRRFSDIALWVVGALIAAGVLVSLTRLGSIGELIDTPYGRALSIKLLIVSMLVAVAAINRLRVAPAIAKSPEAVPRLARNIHFEIVLGGLILIATAVVAHTPPPYSTDHEHALTPGARVPSSTCLVTMARQSYAATVRIAPAPGDTFTASVRLTAANGAPLDAKDVILQIRSRIQRAEWLDRPLVATGRGEFEARGLILPVAGPWDVRIQALVGDFDRIVLEAPADQMCAPAG